MPAETKKARSVVALSRVPRGERGAPVSPPAVSQVFGAASDRRLLCLETSRPFDTPSWRSHSGRLSGLLSGCPPTDTRPQARANLGKHEISGFRFSRKKKSRSARKIFRARERKGFEKLNRRGVERRSRVAQRVTRTP